MRVQYVLVAGILVGSGFLLSSCERGEQGQVASTPESFPDRASRRVIVRSDRYGRVEYAYDDYDYRDDDEWRRRIEQEYDRYEWQEVGADRRIVNEYPEDPSEELYFVEDSSMLEAPSEWEDESYWEEEGQLASGAHYYGPRRLRPHRWRSYDGCSYRVGYYRLRNYCHGSRRHYYPYTPYYRYPRTRWYYQPTYYWFNSFYYYRPVSWWSLGYWTYYTYSIWW